MTMLGRATIIALLQAVLAGTHDVAYLARWAFDQFYSEEEGRVAYEPGYRRVILRVLDDLMFGDDPQFQLDHAQVAGLVHTLETAQYHPNEDDDEDNNDEDDG